MHGEKKKKKSASVCTEKKPPTLHLHAHLKALPESAELAAVAVVLVDHTVLVAAATVGQTLPDTSLEEALAALTANSSVVPP